MKEEGEERAGGERGENGHEGRCILVGAGDFFGLPFPIGETDYLIAADAGYLHLKALSVKPDLLIGDFDSMELPGGERGREERKGISIFSDSERADYLSRIVRGEYEGVETGRIDPVKNDSDLLAACRIGLKKGFREFHLLGAGGKRIDHSIANLQLLAFLAERGCRAYLHGETEIVTALRNGSRRFSPERRGYFSALSFTDFSLGVSERGFRYLIEDVRLTNLLPTGLSNEFIGEEAEISVREGTLLLIYGPPY